MDSPQRRASALLITFAALLLGAQEGETGRATSWKRVPLAEASDAISAVAIEPDTGRLAVGDARGVVLRERGAAARRVVRRGPVRDLAFLPGGGLLAATERGLYLLAVDGRLEDRSPAPGARARSITRIASARGAVAVATAAGTFFSLDARTWRRLEGGLPGGSVSAVTFWSQGVEPGGFDLWLSVEGESWRLPIRLEGVRAREGTPRRERVFGPGVRVVDLLSPAGEQPALALAADRVAVRTGDDGPWRTASLGLPPGAVARRIARAADHYWLATDRGLLEAATPSGPWRRAAPPAGRLGIHALAIGASRTYAASTEGLLVGSRAVPALAGNGGVAWHPRPGEPDVRTVQRAALAYLGLGPERLRSLRRRVDRRGFWPRLDLRLSSGTERERHKDFDQAFISGARRDLFDLERDRSSDRAASLTLTWNLGDAVFHPETLDVSKEAREVIELRDEILDEINQLYFERRRVLMALALLPLDRAETPAEAVRLRLRADELAAGLDAWTGGWFSRYAPPLAP